MYAKLCFFVLSLVESVQYTSVQYSVHGCHSVYCVHIVTVVSIRLEYLYPLGGGLKTLSWRFGARAPYIGKT